MRRWARTVGTKRLRTLALGAFGAVLLVGVSGGQAAEPVVPPPLPTDCAVEQSATCLQTKPDVALVSVEPRGATVGDTVTVTVTPQLPSCPTPAPESAIAALGRCGGTPTWGLGSAGFVDNLKSGTVSATQLGACDGTTLSCSFRIDSVTFPPPELGNRDPLPAWVTLGVSVNQARYDDSLPVGSRVRLERFVVDAPVWVVRPPTTGSIRIGVETVPASDPQSFGFTGLGEFSLDTDPGSALSNQRTLDDVAVGGHLIREVVPPGWQLAGITCSDETGGTTVQLGAATAAIDVAEGETVTCTFHNVKAGAAGLVVNSTSDTQDERVGDGLCETGATIVRNGTQEPECTLRAAIGEANARSGPQTIRFDIPGGSPRIVPASGLPALGGGIAIDGTTQPGVILAAPASPPLPPSGPPQPPSNGLVLQGEGDTVRGLTITGFEIGIAVLGSGHTISDTAIQGSWGMRVESDRSDGPTTRITGNRIEGTTFGITIARGNVVVGGATTVPGESPGNVVSTRGISVGISIGAPGTIVSGNVVSSPARADDSVGILVGDGADGAVVGGISRQAGNRVTGYASGILVGNVRTIGGPPSNLGPGALGARLLNNVVGLGADGRTAEPNVIGIQVIEGTGTVIADNVVSGNQTVGVSVTNDRGAEIRGNRIGTDATGTVAIPNARGLAVLDAAIVGGDATGSTCTGSCNLISGNTGTGVTLARGTFVGNFVGTDVNGRTGLPNDTGVVISSGEARFERNRVAFNRGTGVLVWSDVGSVIRGNVIHDNGLLGIDLSTAGLESPDGVTPNDLLDDDAGPNGLQNFPVIRTMTRSGGQLQVSGDVATGGLGTYTVEFFLSRACDSSGFGEGEFPVGTAATSSLAGGSFSATLQLVILDLVPLERLTATVTGPEGTSEFSRCLDVSIAGGGGGGTAGSTALTFPASVGSSVLQVASTDGLVGRVVQVGEGATMERNYGVREGSLVLARPLRFAHAAAEPVTALDDTLFVTVEKAKLAKVPWLAVLSGTVRPVAGRSIACGEDVTLSLGGKVVAQRLPGTRFVRDRGTHCVFVAKTESGIGRFELDVGKGTWNAELVGRGLSALGREVVLALTIGDDMGSNDVRVAVGGGGTATPPQPAPPKPVPPKPNPPKPVPPKPMPPRHAPPKHAPPTSKPKPSGHPKSATSSKPGNGKHAPGGRR